MRDFRRCKEVEELGREAQQHASRQLKWFYDSEGMLVIKARLPAEAGQMFIKAIEAATHEVEATNVSAETPSVIFDRHLDSGNINVEGRNVSAERRVLNRGRIRSPVRPMHSL